MIRIVVRFVLDTLYYASTSPSLAVVMSTWQPSYVKRVIKVFETSTYPALVVTDAGTGYVKAIGNPQGPHALVCEYVGTRLAAWLGLPVFDHAIVDLQAGLIEYPNGERSHGGAAFITRATDGTPWGGGAQELESLTNSSELAGLVLFDMWTRNCDRYRPRADGTRRNVGNVFFAGADSAPGMFRVVAMDHSACFRCDEEIHSRLFNIDKIRDQTLFGLFPEFVPYIAPASVDLFLSRMRQIEKPVIDSIWATVPREWDCNNETTRTTMSNFIVDRGKFIGQNGRKWIEKHCQWQRDLGLFGAAGLPN